MQNDDVRYELRPWPKGSNKEYYERAPKVVLAVVKAAVELYGREVSLYEIARESARPPHDPTKQAVSARGYTPFDFPDRLRRWLRRLVKQGRLLELGDRRKYFYLPIDEPILREPQDREP